MQHRGNLHRLVAFLGIIVIVMSAHAQANKPETAFTLIENGRPQGIIYLAPGATPTAKMAAEELRDHLQKISGAVIPIVDTLPADPSTPVVLVGPSKAAAERGVTTEGLGAEGYRIKTGKNWLALLGDDTPEQLQGLDSLNGKDPFDGEWRLNVPPYGTLTAVYRFLEAVCDVRWFMPGELGTMAPPRSAVRVPVLDLRGAPVFDERLPRFRDRKGPISPEQKSAMAYWMRRVGFGKTSGTYFNHTFHFLTKNETLRKTKPQIFAQLHDGSRDFSTSYGFGNLCLSEPDTVTEFVKMLRGKFDENPKLREFSINPNDVWVPCMCDKCMATIEPELRAEVLRAGGRIERGTERLNLSHEKLNEFRKASSKLLWKFRVEVARQLQQSHPDRLIGAFGIYEGYGDPKVAGQFDLPSNMAVSITKWRWNFWNPADRESARQTIAAWSKLVKHIYVWEYYLWNVRSWPTRPKLVGYPVFFPRILQEDIRFQRDHHVRGEKFENEGWVESSLGGLNHIMPYLTGRLLFNPDLEVNELLDDYYSKFYGAACGEMRAFWEHAEACWMRNTSGLDYRKQEIEMLETLFTVDDLRQFFSLLAAAKAKVTADSLEFRRIDLIEKEMEPSRIRISDAAKILPDTIGTWRFRPDPNDRGITESWFARTGLPVDVWHPVKVPAFLPTQGNDSFIGFGWYAATLTVPEGYRSRDLELVFEAVDEQAWIYINGQLVGEHSVAKTGKTVSELWDKRFSLRVPADLQAPDGNNRLMVRIHNSSAAAGIWKPVRVLVDSQQLSPRFVSTAVFPPPAIDGAYHDDWGNGIIDLAACKVKVGHDPKNLYLSFAVTDGKVVPPSQVDGGKWVWKSNEGRWLPRGESNTVMIEIQPDPAKKDKQFAILFNASGEIFTAAYGDPVIADPRAWQSGVRKSVKKGNDKSWSGIVAIPWDALGLKLYPGMEIKADISHWRAGTGVRHWSSPSEKQQPAQAKKPFGSISFLEY